MSARPKRSRPTKTAAVVELTSGSESDDEFDRMVHSKSAKRAKLVPNESDFEPSPKKTKTNTGKSKNKLVAKKIVKSLKVNNELSSENEDDEIKIKKNFDISEIDGNALSNNSSNKTKNVPKPKNASVSSVSSQNHVWSDEQLLSEIQNIDHRTSSNIIKLFEDDNTIPFICRYRKELIGNLNPDQLRDIKITYNHIQNIRTRSQTIIKDLKKRDLLTTEISKEIQSAKSLDELDHLYAPFKAESKSTLAERAKALGLLEVSEVILYGQKRDFYIKQFVNKSVEGLETLNKVRDGVKHIIAHIISKDIRVLAEVRRIEEQRNNGIKIHTTLTKTKATTSAAKPTKPAESKKNPSKKNDKAVDESKFSNYFDFQVYVNNIQPHQVLAINRGESLKVLAVKIVIPDHVKNTLLKLIQNIFFNQGICFQERTELLAETFDEAYNKKLKPLISRKVRSTLTKNAEKASIEVFATNLKQLLLLSPVKGKKILGIDPGFLNGCKLALISECTDIIQTAVIYPHTRQSNAVDYGRQIANMLKTHNCDLIAVGNGTACRETELWLTELLKSGVLDSRKVRYCIVSEQGASIYSCGDVAKKEFPDLDVNLISAVSIARRLSDPLAELVKVEPKHLGVGMYQHDVNEKLLQDSLNEVVMECVSYVGVDINTASVTLLKHIAGLSSSRADSIIQHRIKNGPFKARDELKKVKSIGDKTFTQCAGFVRIEPLTAGVSSYNLLDSTWVHPESYQLAAKIIKKLGLSAKEIGSPSFISKIKQNTSETRCSKEKLAEEFSVPEERIEGVLNALSRELFQDYRSDFEKQPLFKQGLMKISDLKEGTNVSGAISNITTFGCFVDIGVEKDALIHVSQFRGFVPKIGDRVNAVVSNVEAARRRIQLRLA